MLALALALVALLPPRAVLVPHESLAGVRLGETPAQVRAALGDRTSLCGPACPEPTWFYFNASREAGLAVAFRSGRVAAVYTLGSPPGWRSTDGLRIGRLAEPLPSRYASARGCTGYLAHSDRRRGSVTSVFVVDRYVMGFALTLPSEPVCR